MAVIRILQPGDEEALEAFLLRRVESSMFLIGNMRASGLVDGGRPYQGTYAAAFEGGRIVGVVAHYWQGNLVLQAPAHLEDLSRAASRSSGRPLRGLIGPDPQVRAARLVFDISDRSVQLDELEKLYSLALADLVVPSGLQSGELRGRRIEPHDVPLMVEWHVAFAGEALGEDESPRLRERVRAGVERQMRQGHFWLLEDRGEPVACSAFNTVIREAVQVGGVWTPPELRNRGYGRTVVAASLLDARAGGAETAILFTGEGNLPAQRAYEALGFRHVGDYRLLLLRPE